MPTTTPIAAPRKRRWFQFNLRTLLAVVTVICILLGTVVNLVVVPAERQRAAVQTIERLGGSFYYFVMLPGEESWFRWTLRKWLPQDYCDSVSDVFLASRSKLVDSDLESLGGLIQLRSLNLYGNKVTDAGLLHLKGLTQLKYLELGETQVTNEGVKELQEALPNCIISP